MHSEAQEHLEKFRVDLAAGPQLITVADSLYLCYAEVATRPGTFVGVRHDCHCTFLVDPTAATITPVEPSNTIITVSAHYVSPGKLLRRLRRCSLRDTHGAVSQLFTSGAAIPRFFCTDLSAALSVFVKEESALPKVLAKYSTEDLQGSPRLRRACAQGLDILLERLGLDQP
jgi:hypothetical protein